MVRTFRAQADNIFGIRGLGAPPSLGSIFAPGGSEKTGCSPLTGEHIRPWGEREDWVLPPHWGASSLLGGARRLGAPPSLGSIFAPGGSEKTGCSPSLKSVIASGRNQKTGSPPSLESVFAPGGSEKTGCSPLTGEHLKVCSSQHSLFTAIALHGNFFSQQLYLTAFPLHGTAFPLHGTAIAPNSIPSSWHCNCS